MGARLGVLAAVGLLMFALLGFRLWFLQVLSGESYEVLAQNNRVREVEIEASRGVIYDRDGNTLVENRAGLSVAILPMDMKNENVVVPRLANVLKIPAEDIWRKLEQGKDNPYLPIIIKEDVSEAPVVTYLKEHSLEFPGVTIRKSYLRNYPEGRFAAHLLGHVGEISAEELETEEFRTLHAGQRVGKNGVETTYDSYLRGESGSRQIEVDASGRPKRVVEVVEPTPGNNLVLTLESELQQSAEKAIREGLERAHDDGFSNAEAGAVVALDPQNGEILAMASHPDYDPSTWVGGMSQEDYNRLKGEGARKPLFNRAVNGQYPAASTFKPFVAAASLKTDQFPWTMEVDCDGSYTAAGQVWKDWIPEGHGKVNLLEAITQSCDVYFYTLGENFFNQRGPVLQDGLREFGFGEPTGVDIPGEYSGRVPDSEWKRKAGETDIDRLWKTGDDINLAIGQGDLLVTPLQLAVGSAAIANGGDVLIPRLGRRITDAGGDVIHEFEQEVRGRVEMNQEELEIIRKGLLNVTATPRGTAHDAFRDFPIEVAGKTGTAEKRPEDDYAWFMGYAPAQDPEILVVALIEQGGHGSSVAAPVVRRVMGTFFQTETSPPENVTVTE